MGIHKDELKNYCLRKLGAPVVEINVTPDQLDDAVDDTIQLFNEAHGDGTEKFFVKHIVTQADIDRGYVELPDSVTAVVRVLPLNSSFSFYTSEPMFNPIYRFMLDEVWDLNSTSLVSYTLAMQQVRLIEQLFQDTPNQEFNVNTGRLRLDMNWGRFDAGESVLIIEVYKNLNPEEFYRAYSDRWVKKYCTAMIKKQWGNNLKKFDGVQLPGGITLNGQQIYEEAVEEITQLEEELQLRYELPIDFFMGASI